MSVEPTASGLSHTLKQRHMMITARDDSPEPGDRRGPVRSQTPLLLGLVSAGILCAAFLVRRRFAGDPVT